MTENLLFNFAFLLPLFATGCFYLLTRIPGSMKSYSWLIFYFAYFNLLFFNLFLPLPLEWKPSDFSKQLQSVEWNPFITWIEGWKTARIKLISGQVDPLVKYFVRHVGNFLLYMPLADFLYSALPKINRRQCFCLVFFLALLLETLQFFLVWLSGKPLCVVSLTDVFTAALGAAIFLILSSLTERSVINLPDLE